MSDYAFMMMGNITHWRFPGDAVRYEPQQNGTYSPHPLAAVGT
jgi:hypothetical protein